MADASFLQTSFLGGAWGPYAQGRADKEQYRTALSVCLNGLPIEVGAWTRRPATVTRAPTRGGARALVRDFAFSESLPFILEFTAGHMRVFEGMSLVLENPHAVSAISTVSPAVVQTPVAHGYLTGDQVQIELAWLPTGQAPTGMAPVINKQWAIDVIDTTHFSLTDAVTGVALDGSTLTLAGWGISVARVVDFATPYTENEIAANGIRVVQDQDIALTMDGLNPPKVFANNAGNTLIPTAATNNACFPTFNYEEVAWNDGPYLDPPTDGSTLTAQGLGSPVTLDASAITSINDGRGFLSTDVGRLIRLFSEPPNWSAGTGYTKGQNVKWEGAYWQALQSSTGSQPDTSVTNWAVTTAAAAWTWGTITTVISTSSITATLAAPDPYGVWAGGDLLNGEQPILTWQLGVYSNTTGWPTGGCYHEGRFWLFGAQFNRADSTMSDNGGTPETQALWFNPTALDGTVADNNGISIELQNEQVNTIFWMVGTQGGIAMGTQGGEFLVRASETNDPITPASVQAKRVTKFGCANVEPRQLPLAIGFVDRYNKKLIEYLQEPFSGRSLGFNLSINSTHLMTAGIQEIAYTQERAPVVWARMGDGTLKGLTYKRESPFGTQPASFFGWHEHSLGSGRLVESISSGPSPGGASDTLTLVTQDTVSGVFYVEAMSPMFEETDALTVANYVDSSTVPAFAYISGDDAVFEGLLPGYDMDAWVGGLDAGTFTVAADGTITVPLNAAGSALTTSYLESLNGGDYGYLDAVIQVSEQGVGFYSPVGVALDYVYGTNYTLHSASEFQKVVFDWDAGRFYALCSNSAGVYDHMEIMDIATRAEIANVATDEIANANTTATCLGYDQHIYYGTSDGTQLINRWNTTTHATDISWDDTGSAWVGGVPDPAVGFTCAIQQGGLDYVLFASLDSGMDGGSSSAIGCVQMTGAGAPQMCFGPLYLSEEQSSLSDGSVYMCRGSAVGSVNCFGWAAAHLLAIAGDGSVIGLYTAVVEGPKVGGIGRVGSITPAEAHAGDTSFSSMGQPVLDETDGNLIFNATTNVASYIVKVSTRTAAVLWAIAVTENVDYHSSRVRGGRFSYLDGASSPYTLKEINTLTGAVTTQSETTIAPTNFSTDDKAGQVVANINDIGTTHWATFGPASGGGSITPGVTYTVPAVFGFNYSSRGQLLRRVDPEETGARNGPALGKTRRTHMAAYQLAQTGVGSFYYGTDFGSTQHKATLMTYPGATKPLALTQMYAGVFWTTIEDTYGFDGMISWEIKRPYPAAVVAAQGFLHTQDR